MKATVAKVAALESEVAILKEKVRQYEERDKEAAKKLNVPTAAATASQHLSSSVAQPVAFPSSNLVTSTASQPPSYSLLALFPQCDHSSIGLQLRRSLALSQLPPSLPLLLPNPLQLLLLPQLLLSTSPSTPTTRLPMECLRLMAGNR